MLIRNARDNLHFICRCDLDGGGVRAPLDWEDRRETGAKLEDLG